MRFTVKAETRLVRKGLQDLTAEIPKIGRWGVWQIMLRSKRRLEEYPPEHAGQSRRVKHSILGYTIKALRYKRTGNLGSHWKVERFGDTGYTIENTATRKGRAYGHYVHGDAYGLRQARVHKGWWALMRNVVDEETKKAPSEIEDRLQMVARRVGL